MTDGLAIADGLAVAAEDEQAATTTANNAAPAPNQARRTIFRVGLVSR
jgi:hypothetical protein